MRPGVVTASGATRPSEERVSMSEKLSSNCLCVKEGAVAAEIVDEKGCVCGCFGTTVNRYPALFHGLTFSKDEIAAVMGAGQKR